MLGRHFIKSLRGICVLQSVLSVNHINVRIARRSPTLNWTEVPSQNRFSGVAQAQPEWTDMQPISGCGTGTEDAADNDLLITSPGPVYDNVSTGPVPGQNHLNLNVTEPTVNEDDKDGGKTRLRRGARKARGRRQKPKASECCDNLMAELPFASTAMWKDLGFTKPEGNLKMKRKMGESEQDAEKKRKKKETQRPNYFVSIPVTNPEIKEAVAAIQRVVLQRDPRLARALVPVGSLHLTLLVTHLANQDQVNLAVCAVSQMEAALQELLRGRELVLPFCGVGQFRNEVVFAELAPGEHLATLARIAELARRAFEERGLSSGDSKDFKPHLTFMKLSRAPKLRSQGVKKLNPALYSEHAQLQLGEERVSRLDLCSMLKNKTPDGYYHREASVTFGVKRGAAPDDEELQRLSRRLVEDAVLRAVQQYRDETQHNGGGPAGQNGGGPTEPGTARPGENLNANAGTAMTTPDPNAS